MKDGAERRFPAPALLCINFLNPAHCRDAAVYQTLMCLILTLPALLPFLLSVTILQFKLLGVWATYGGCVKGE
jgi:hypothetical protein